MKWILAAMLAFSAGPSWAQGAFSPQNAYGYGQLQSPAQRWEQDNRATQDRWNQDFRQEDDRASHANQDDDE